MVDDYRHKGLRQKLVMELMSKGITDTQVLRAISEIPRHFFLDKAFDNWAYKDIAFPIDADQTISQPYTVAFQTQLLEIQTRDKVLEIGTGSGYQASVLSKMGAKVYTIERQKKLFDKTSEILHRMGYGSIRTLYGDGFLGAPRFAPFDKIIITAAAPYFPETLFGQLKIGGYLVIPLGEGQVQKMMRITKLSETQKHQEIFGTFSFVPMLSGTNTH